LKELAMTTTPFVGGSDALKLLSTQDGRRAASRAVLDQLSRSEPFQSIFEQARGGGVASGIQAKATRESGVALTPEQAERLSAAADIAEAHGAGRAVFLIDGQALRMDVGTRTVLGAVDMSETGVLTDVDAIVTVAAPGAHKPARVMPPGATPGMNASLLDALAKSG
jgi:hypothetical protein